MLSKSPQLYLRLLGQMAAWTGTDPDNRISCLPAARKDRALLAVVALSAPRPVLRTRLAELIWNGRSAHQANQSLRYSLHCLRKTLRCCGDGILRVTREHVSIDASTLWIDAREIKRSTSINLEDFPLEEGDLLEEMVGNNPALDRWIVAEQERLRDHVRSVAEAALRQQANPEDMITAAQRLLSIDRVHEEAWRALISCYAAMGDRPMAIEAYRRCKAALADHAGTEPAPETQCLFNEILDHRDTQVATKAVRPETDTSSNMIDNRRKLPQHRPIMIGEAAAASSYRVPSKPCIGVMPLKLLGSDNEGTDLATIVSEEIANTLSFFRWMSVVPESVLGRLATGHDEAAIRHTVGADFLLTGTLLHASDHHRLNYQLLDVRSPAPEVIWTQRFDVCNDIFLERLNEISSQAAAQIDARIRVTEAQRLARRGQNECSAHELVLRAQLNFKLTTPQSFAMAGADLEQAIRVDPDSAPAHAWYALWHNIVVGQGWAHDIRTAIDASDRLVERAIQLDPYDASALTICGHARAFLHRRLNDAAGLHERSLQINPSLAMTWAFSAITHTYLGNIKEAEKRYTKYKALSPLDPLAFMFDGFGALIDLVKRDNESAVANGSITTQLAPTLTAGLKTYLSALGHVRRGGTPEAHAARQRLLSIEPEFSLARYANQCALVREDDRGHVTEGLRLAGIT